ncbi:hypothetical protein EDB84DRAFT_1502230 [Lactarius hengduanensis]|nr:hypothetical protein EDB84DRAFT_1502230 [Lactarius hengduanensis]
MAWVSICTSTAALAVALFVGVGDTQMFASSTRRIHLEECGIERTRRPTISHLPPCSRRFDSSGPWCPLLLHDAPISSCVSASLAITPLLLPRSSCPSASDSCPLVDSSAVSLSPETPSSLRTM